MLVLLFLALTVTCSAQDTLKIVSWNVYLRPEILTDFQRERVGDISSALLNTKADVLCLQELFHARHRRRLIDTLKREYPYYVHPGKSGFKQCSGLMIFSKYKITGSFMSYYRQHRKADAMANKGIQIADIWIGDTILRVANTHMQSGGEAKSQQIRDMQYRHLKTAVQSYYSWEYVIAGDLNTNADSNSFNTFCQLLNVCAEDSICYRHYCTANFPECVLNPGSGGKRIDYILMQQGSSWCLENTSVSRPVSVWYKGEMADLSDHAMVLTTFVRRVNKEE